MIILYTNDIIYTIMSIYMIYKHILLYMYIYILYIQSISNPWWLTTDQIPLQSSSSQGFLLKVSTGPVPGQVLLASVATVAVALEVALQQTWEATPPGGLAVEEI